MQVSRAPGSSNRVPDSSIREIVYPCTNAICSKKFVITPPKSINMSQHQFLKHQIQYLKFPTAARSHTIHSTLHIQYSILQNIIDKFNILKVLKSYKIDIFNIQLVRIYKTTYIFCSSIIYKNNSFSVTLAALDSLLEYSLGF
jgi:hypothetical protein